MDDDATIFIGLGGGEPQRLCSQARQPPRPDRRRDRHRQDGDAAGPRRGLLGRRRPGLRRRREGRSRRHGDARLADRADARRSSPTRAAEIGLADYAYADNPVVFWDLFGEQGHPIRTTVSRDGAAAARPADGPQRDAGRRAHHRLPRRRRAGPAAARPRRPAGDAGPLRRARRASSTADYGNVTRPTRRHDPAPAARSSRARAAAMFFGEPALEIADFIARRRAGPRHGQHPRRRQADGEPASSTPPSCSGCCPSCSRSCPRSAIPTSRSSSSSSTRRTCCSTTRPPALLEKIEQVVRLIRSKGVGVYLRHPEPDRHSRGGRRPARQPRPARAARLHAEGPEGDPRRGRDLPHQSRRRRRDRDHRAEGRRGAGLAARGGRRADAGRAHADPAAALAARPADRQGARDHPLDLAGRRQIRQRDRPRERRGDPEGARRGGGHRRGAGRRGRDGRAGAEGCARRPPPPRRSEQARLERERARQSRPSSEQVTHAIRANRAAPGDQPRRRARSCAASSAGCSGGDRHGERPPPATMPLRELTFRGILLGGVITLLFTAANVYLGLKVGLTFATSIPAAVISMAILRFVPRLDHPREQYRPDHRLGGGHAGGDHLRAAGPGHDRLVERLPLLDDGRGLRDRRHPRRDVLGAAAARAGRPDPTFPIPKASPRPRC